MNYTAAKEISSLLKIKRSTFTGTLIPITSIEDVSKHLKSLKKANPKARHICWAYRYQENGIISENSSDAGEPSGTAGTPILNTLRSKDMVQTVLFVLRIFGGVKLGKRGLIDAYGASALKTILALKPIRWEEKIRLIFTGQLSHYSDYYRFLEEFSGTIIADDSQLELKWTIEIPLNQSAAFMDAINGRFEGFVKVWKDE